MASNFVFAYTEFGHRKASLSIGLRAFTLFLYTETVTVYNTKFVLNYTNHSSCRVSEIKFSTLNVVMNVHLWRQVYRIPTCFSRGRRHFITSVVKDTTAHWKLRLVCQEQPIHTRVSWFYFLYFCFNICTDFFTLKKVY